MVRLRSDWPGNDTFRSIRQEKADADDLRSHTARRRFGHPGEYLIGRKGAGHPLREIRHDLVRGCPLAVDEPVGDPLHLFPHGLECNRHNRRGDDRESQIRAAGAADHGPQPGHDCDIDGGDKGGKSAEYQ